MKGKRIAYKRVSSVDQETYRQLDGMEFDKIFEDKFTGSVRERLQLEEMIDYVREDDHITVHSIDRLARNLQHLLELVDLFNREGVTIHFHKENMTFAPGTDNAMQNLMLQVMGACAQFERSMINERQKEAIAAARVRGVKFGRKPRFPEKVRDEIRDLLKTGEVSQNQLALRYECSRSLIQKIVKEGLGRELIAQE